MLSRKYFLPLILTVLTACAPTASAPTATSLSATITPVVATSTATPLVALTQTALACRFEEPPKLPPSQFAEWCNTGCPLRQDQYMVIASSENAEKCHALFPLNDYKVIGFSFTFPVWWTVHPTGAEGINLIFETDQKQEVFVQLTRKADLTLERADEATYMFERHGPDPLVAPEERRISKEIQTIGDKETLVLITELDDFFIKRYFLIHDNTLYMFEMKTPRLNSDEEENAALFLQVEEIISSIQFLR
ncbi:MAG: hypothetical protein MHPDNHAH_01261 [Anaerolineales bacterium]|nr:hypothetical protein [Anaerolineales bacterium]